MTTAATQRQQAEMALSSELMVAARQWRRVADLALSTFGISSATALPLLMIGRLGDERVRQVTLAHAVGIEGPSLVRLLDQLCHAQLARRDDDPDDGRAKIVSLTDAGRALVLQIEADLAQLRTRVLESVSDHDLAVALRVLSRFKQDPFTLTEDGKSTS